MDGRSGLPRVRLARVVADANVVADGLTQPQLNNGGRIAPWALRKEPVPTAQGNDRR